MISTRSLDGLPSIAELRRRVQSLAMLDAMMCPEWEDRYYSFNASWGPGEEMGSMRDGQGSGWFAVFSEAGAALTGLALESPMFRKAQPWPGIWDSLPEPFARVRAEPAFDTNNTTFCIWRTAADVKWHRGEIEFPAGHADPDGSADLMALLDGDPRSYSAWAGDYYEREIPLDAIASVYQLAPMTAELVEAVNPEASLGSLREDIEQIGYPLAG